MLAPGSELPAGGVQVTKRAPSNRTRPVSVPIHRYPSAVCVATRTAPDRYPSSARQAVCPYCEIWRFGSSACARLAPTSNKAKR
jgi:hypothetical protein